MKADEEQKQKRKLSPVTPDEAVQILQSAVRYCVKAGLKVQGGNSPTGFLLRVEGVRLEGGALVLVKEKGD